MVHPDPAEVDERWTAPRLCRYSFALIDENRFARDKTAIRAEMERRARAGLFITYAEATALVGRVPQGLGRIPDAIKAEEAPRGMPDLGCLVVTVRTALPRYVGLTKEASAAAFAVRKAVFSVWA